jgi:hypothetical protein
MSEHRPGHGLTHPFRQRGAAAILWLPGVGHDWHRRNQSGQRGRLGGPRLVGDCKVTFDSRT